jgi:hypothetical protein
MPAIASKTYSLTVKSPNQYPKVYFGELKHFKFCGGGKIMPVVFKACDNSNLPAVALQLPGQSQ